MKHPHYFKSVAGLQHIDVYRVLRLFGVADPCLQHAIKKLLVAGGRGGGKDISKDVEEAIDSLRRWQEMASEDAAPQPQQSADPMEGGWVVWDGHGTPASRNPGQFFELRLRSGAWQIEMFRAVRWTITGEPDDVLMYRPLGEAFWRRLTAGACRD